jgi:hypothetical protein
LINEQPGISSLINGPAPARVVLGFADDSTVQLDAADDRGERICELAAGLTEAAAGRRTIAGSAAEQL